MRFHRLATAAAVIGAATMLAGETLSAQQAIPFRSPDAVRAPIDTTRWYPFQQTSPVVIPVFYPRTVTSLNIGVGLLTGAYSAIVHHEPLGPALKRGAIAGVANAIAMYAVSRSSDLTWPAKAVNAIASSELRALREGKPKLEEIIVPLGPTVLHISHDGITTKVAPDRAADMLFATMQGCHYDVGMSLRGAAPVCRMNLPSGTLGYSGPGVVRIAPRTPDNTITISRRMDRQYDIVELKSLVNWSPSAQRMILGHETLHGFESTTMEAVAGGMRYQPIDEFITGTSAVSKLHLGANADKAIDWLARKGFETDGLRAGGLEIAERLIFPYDTRPRERLARMAGVDIARPFEYRVVGLQPWYAALQKP